MNKYASCERFYRARNIYAGTIAPPADLAIGSAAWVTQLFAIPATDLRKSSNIFMKSVGLYSNFADGLVFKSPAESINLTLIAYATTRTLLYNGIAAWVDATATISALVGTGTTFIADLPGSNYILVGDQYFQTAAGAPPTNFLVNLRQPALSTMPFSALYKLTPIISPPFVTTFSVRQLNTQFKLENFIDVTSLSTTPATDILFLVQPTQDATFLTKTIDASYSGDPVYFDVGIELEITPQ